MKSDKEFLEGIYQKAEKYKETDLHMKNKQNVYNKNKKFISYAIVAILALALLPFPMKQWILTYNKKTNVEQYNHVKQQKGAQEDLNSANAARQINTSIHEIIYGEIINIEIKNEMINVTIIVEQAYSSYVGEKLEFSYYNDSDTSFDKPKFEVGEKALFYLEETQTGFKMSSTPNGKCRLIKEENGIKQFEALDGSIITEDTLMQPN